jgi:oligoribonuclease NrnB/cAMP/cGMP phosphodiesterase (DHH superfamily)
MFNIGFEPGEFDIPGLEEMFTISDYIQDRDLWNWKLDNSKEISEYFKFMVKPNDLESFKKMILNFNIDNARNIGETLNQARDRAVQAKVKNYREINIAGTNLVCINLTENISEVGNELCKLTGKPAMMYFIKEDLQVILSFRSLDELPDVSLLAKYFGGGGHRNACGATIDMIKLINILNNHYFSPDTNSDSSY